MSIIFGFKLINALGGYIYAYVKGNDYEKAKKAAEEGWGYFAERIEDIPYDIGSISGIAFILLPSYKPWYSEEPW